MNTGQQVANSALGIAALEARDELRATNTSNGQPIDTEVLQKQEEAYTELVSVIFANSLPNVFLTVGG